MHSEYQGVWYWESGLTGNRTTCISALNLWVEPRYASRPNFSMLAHRVSIYSVMSAPALLCVLALLFFCFLLSSLYSVHSGGTRSDVAHLSPPFLAACIEASQPLCVSFLRPLVNSIFPRTYI